MNSTEINEREFLRQLEKLQQDCNKIPGVMADISLIKQKILARGLQAYDIAAIKEMIGSLAGVIGNATNSAHEIYLDLKERTA